jgi:hypothetical protein
VATRAPYWPSIAQYTRMLVKPDIVEKLKINISTRRIQTKLSTRKHLNTKSIYSCSLSENDETFRRYSTFSRYEKAKR